MNKDSKIIVTGANGMLGRALVAELVAAGYKVLCATRAMCDLRHADNVNALFRTERPDYVFHIAARVYGIGGNLADPAGSLTDNVRINTNVVDCAHRYRVKKILAMGTGAIYPDSTAPLREEEIWDGPPHASEAGYAHAKRLMLAHLQAGAKQYEVPYVYVVSGNLYGPHDKFDAITGHVVPALIAKFHAAEKSGKAVKVWGSGRAVRDFMYVDDAAAALLLLMLKAGGPVNMGSGSLYTIKEIVQHLNALNGSATIEWDRAMPDGQETRTYDLSKLNALGFKAQTSLPEGLKKTVDWYREKMQCANVL